MKENKILTDRVYYLDVLRTIACLSVIMFHVSGNALSGIASEKGLDAFLSVDYWVFDLFYAVSRLGVPLFVMISGALILDEKYDFNQNRIIKHIKKIGVFYLFWFLIYALFFKVALPVVHNESISLNSFFSVIENDAYHLWFCPMIVGLYLVSPLLKKWVIVQNKKSIEYFLLLCIVFSVVIPSVLNVLSGFTDISIITEIYRQFEIKPISGYVFYYILGWYLYNFDIRNKKLLAVLAGLGLLITIFANPILSTLLQEIVNYHNFFNPNNMVMSVFVFLVAKNRFSKHNTEKKAFYSVFSKYSFGVYGVHEICIYLSTVFFYKLSIHNSLAEIVFIFIITTIMSYLIVFAMSKIPLLKRVV